MLHFPPSLKAASAQIGAICGKSLSFFSALLCVLCASAFSRKGTKLKKAPEKIPGPF
jgi:hypothetical protein